MPIYDWFNAYAMQKKSSLINTNTSELPKTTFFTKMPLNRFDLPINAYTSKVSTKEHLCFINVNCNI